MNRFDIKIEHPYRSTPQWYPYYRGDGKYVKYEEVELLLKRMAEALEELDDRFDPTSEVGEIINGALRAYREQAK